MRALIVAGWLIGLSTGTARAEGGLRLMSYNLNFANPNITASLAVVAREDPDVVVLQEVTDGWQTAIEKALASRYPHRLYHVPAGRAGGALLSKLPISNHRLLAALPDSFHPGERAVLTTPDGKQLQLLHIHLRAPIDRGSWIRGFFTTRAVRRREIEAHYRQLDPALPTVVVGDYNDPADGGVLAYLATKGLQRAPSAGPKSWHFDALALDIDHVAVDARILASDVTVLDAGTSDHRPLTATLRVR